MNCESKAGEQTSQKGVRAFRKIVLDHWKKHGRHDLPWRQTTDPYKILVSEIMLQQTQVERVIPFYMNFLQKFPSSRALAKAPLTDVLRAWSGLGYNRRAKLLQETARAVVTTHGGIFPSERDSLVALPGIGPYTAGAIRAFAFNEPGFFIETNIRTAILHHFYPDQLRSKGIEQPGVKDADILVILKAATKGQDSREWYSALMDYGAHLKKSGVRINNKSAHYAKQSKFEGSLRQVRGAIVRELLKAPAAEREIIANTGFTAELIRKRFGHLRGSGWS